jgi:excisionase family DNA binding protein
VAAVSADRAKTAAAFIHGEGRTVVVPHRVAWQLVERAGLGSYATETRGRDEEVDNVLMALRIAARVWEQDCTSATSGSRLAEVAEVPAPSGLMSTKQAADRLDITDRAVRLACRQGRLPALREGRSYRIDPAHLEHYRTQRAS